MKNKSEELLSNSLQSFLGFNGERLDFTLGGYHLGNGYRIYNSSLLRFTSPDSLSPLGGGGINAYTYCEGDPVNNTDPTGHVIIRHYSFSDAPLDPQDWSFSQKREFFESGGDSSHSQIDINGNCISVEQNQNIARKGSLLGTDQCQAHLDHLENILRTASGRQGNRGTGQHNITVGKGNSGGSRARNNWGIQNNSGGSGNGHNVVARQGHGGTGYSVNNLPHKGDILMYSPQLGKREPIGPYKVNFGRFRPMMIRSDETYIDSEGLSKYVSPFNHHGPGYTSTFPSGFSYPMSPAHPIYPDANSRFDAPDRFQSPHVNNDAATIFLLHLSTLSRPIRNYPYASYEVTQAILNTPSIPPEHIFNYW